MTAQQALNVTSTAVQSDGVPAWVRKGIDTEAQLGQRKLYVDPRAIIGHDTLRQEGYTIHGGITLGRCWIQW